MKLYLRLITLLLVTLCLPLGQVWAQSPNPSPEYKADVKTITDKLRILAKCPAVGSKLTPRLVFSGLSISVAGTLIQKLWSNKPFQELRLVQNIKSATEDLLNKTVLLENLTQEEIVLKLQVETVQSLLNEHVEAGMILVKTTIAQNPEVSSYASEVGLDAIRGEFTLNYLERGITEETSTTYQMLIKHSPENKTILDNLRDKYWLDKTKQTYAYDAYFKKLTAIKDGRLSVNRSLRNFVATLNESQQSLRGKVFAESKRMKISDFESKALQTLLDELSTSEKKFIGKANSIRWSRMGAWGLVPLATIVAVLIAEYTSENGKLAGGVVFEDQKLADLSDDQLVILARRCVDNYGKEAAQKLLDDVYRNSCATKFRH